MAYSKRTTIKDVAKAAAVSPTTVSRYLNGKLELPRHSSSRIDRAIAALDYRPSFSARHMRTRQSHVIGFITDEIATTPFAGRTIEGAQSLAWSFEKLLFVVNTYGDAKMEGAVIEHMLARQVEGVIYAAMYHKEVSPPKLLKEVPTVLLDCYSEDGTFTSVVPDETQAGLEGTELLIHKGHRRIAFINARDGAAATTKRLEGYKKALAKHGLPFDDALVRYGNWAADGGFEHTLAVMKLAEPPTALFCANDRTAMGAYEALRELGLRVPDEVAVLGFDNQEMIAAYLRPALSTMALPHLEMGRRAVSLLLNPDALTSGQEKLPCPFIARESI